MHVPGSSLLYEVSGVEDVGSEMGRQARQRDNIIINDILSDGKLRERNRESNICIN